MSVVSPVVSLHDSGDVFPCQNMRMSGPDQ